MNQKPGNVRFPLGNRGRPNPNRFPRPVRPWMTKSAPNKRITTGPMTPRGENLGHGISNSSPSSFNDRPSLLPIPNVAGSRTPQSGSEKSDLNSQNLKQSKQKPKNKATKPVYKQWPRFKSIITGNNKMPNSPNRNLTRREDAGIPEASDRYEVNRGALSMPGMSQNMSRYKPLSSSHFSEGISRNQNQSELVNSRIGGEIFKNPNDYNISPEAAYPGTLGSKQGGRGAVSYESLRVSPINRGNSGSFNLEHTHIEWNRAPMDSEDIRDYRNSAQDKPSYEERHGLGEERLSQTAQYCERERQRDSFSPKRGDVGRFTSQSSGPFNQTGPTDTTRRKRPYPSTSRLQDAEAAEQARSFETEGSYGSPRKKPCLGFQKSRFPMTNRNTVDPIDVGVEPYSPYQQSRNAQEMVDPYYPSDHKATPPYDRKKSPGIDRTSPYSDRREVRYSGKNSDLPESFHHSSVSELEEDIFYEKSAASSKKNVSVFHSEGLRDSQSNSMAEPPQRRLYYENRGEIEDVRHFESGSPFGIEDYSRNRDNFGAEDSDNEDYFEGGGCSRNEKDNDFDYRTVYAKYLDDLENSSRDEEGCSFWVDNRPMSTDEKACHETEFRSDNRAKQGYPFAIAPNKRVLLETPEANASEVSDENRTKQGYPNFSTSSSQRALLKTPEVGPGEVRGENRAKIGYPNLSAAYSQRALLKTPKVDASKVWDENRGKIGYPNFSPSPIPRTSKKPKTDASSLHTSAQSNTMDTAIKMAVVKASYPRGQFRESEENAILEDVLRRIDSMKSDFDLPKFNWCFLNFGALFFHCSDQKTADWLKVQYNYNKTIFPKCTLRVLNQSELQRPVTVTFKTRNMYTKDPRLLFDRLRLFNPEFMCHQWRVLDIVEQQNQIVWTFSMPLKESQSLRFAGLKGFTGIDQGVFEILDSPFFDCPLPPKIKKTP